MKNSKTKTIRKRILKHLGNVCMALVSVTLMAAAPVGSVDPSDAAKQVIGSEGGQIATKEVLNSALKMAKSKPAMIAATGIVCLASIPAVGVAASPGMCIACGILIAKTLG